MRILEWLNRWWPVKFSNTTKFGMFKFGGKRYER